MKKEELKGFKTYRHADNPKEKELHDQFVRLYSIKDMERIVFGHTDPTGNVPSGRLSVREQRIVISTVQWLFTTVGYSFIRSLGFCEEREFIPKEKLFSTKIASLEKQLDKIPRWIRLIYK